jgi:hypothetical protein
MDSWQQYTTNYETMLLLQELQQTAHAFCSADVEGSPFGPSQKQLDSWQQHTTDTEAARTIGAPADSSCCVHVLGSPFEPSQ